jgi:hypothetical protein
MLLKAQTSIRYLGNIVTVVQQGLTTKMVCKFLHVRTLMSVVVLVRLYARRPLDWRRPLDRLC